MGTLACLYSWEQRICVAVLQGAMLKTISRQAAAAAQTASDMATAFRRHNDSLPDSEALVPLLAHELDGLGHGVALAGA